MAGFLLLGFIVAILAFWAAYKLTIYALPCMLGFCAADFAFETGAGHFGALIVFLLVALLAYAALAIAFSTTRSAGVRMALAIPFVGAALYAGYNIAFDVMAGVPSPLWRQAISIAIALIGGLASFAKLAQFDEMSE